MKEFIFEWMPYIKWTLITIQILLIAITSMLLKVDKLREELKNHNILFITAHPDDESLFFSPLILMLQPTNRLRLLCLSNGNSKGLGKVREEELGKAVKYLGLEGYRVVDDSLLQDGKNANWSQNVISQYIQEEINKHRITLVISFDSIGITGHPNHQAISRALVELNGKDQTKYWQLESCGPLRMKIGICDSVISVWNQWSAINLNPFVVWKALRFHRSSFDYKRKIYALFSRYTYINSLTPI
jgi:N-acetylglucosaminylphosphatidylinositol deacetylase